MGKEGRELSPHAMDIVSSLVTSTEDDKAGLYASVKALSFFGRLIST